jgi:hypothetical protein
MDYNRVVRLAALPGVVAGFVSFVPIVSLACPLWIALAGSATAYLCGKNSKIDVKDGAIYGGVSGAIAGLTMILVASIFFTALGTLLNQSLYGFGNMFSIGVMVFFGVLYIILGSVFGAVGGVLYALFLGEKTPVDNSKQTHNPDAELKKSE